MPVVLASLGPAYHRSPTPAARVLYIQLPPRWNWAYGSYSS